MKRGTWGAVGLTVLIMLAASHLSTLRGIAGRLLAMKDPLLRFSARSGLTEVLAGSSPAVAVIAVAILPLSVVLIVIARRRWVRSRRAGPLGRRGEPLFAVARRKQAAQDALRTNLAVSASVGRARARGSHATPPQMRPAARQDLPGGTNRRTPTPQPWMPPNAGIDAPVARWSGSRRVAGFGYDPCLPSSDPRPSHARGRR